ncbi:MAG: Rrf2 family transcriptional regulator [Clostridiales bacterium]|mgnify:CR=1 FL=1|jgi:Rrf2 family protein|nr:Rrf2 family transcriptional regulator [Clostridiales bacterium]
MRLSAKGRYALAAAISMAEQYSSGEPLTVISISEKLGISKVYLEQVFALLKRGGIVNSIKGAQGGYQFTRTPQNITMLDILSAVEFSLSEPAEDTVSKNAPEIEVALKYSFAKIDNALKITMESITLSDLVNEAEKSKPDSGFMYFI